MFNLNWSRLKPSIEWGVFYGLVTWLAFTALTNKTPALGIWGMIVSRTVICILAYGMTWQKPFWLRGLIWGVAGHIPFALLALLHAGSAWDAFFFGWTRGWGLMAVSGLIAALFMEWTLYRRAQHEASSESAG